MPQNITRFMQKTLMADEKVIMSTGYPAYYIFSACLGFAAFIFLGAAAQYVLAHFAHIYTSAPTLIGAAVGAMMFLSAALTAYSTEFIMTNRRLICKRGLMSVRVVEVDIEQLASDNVTQSFMGRLCDFGSIHIRCIEANDIDMNFVARPYAFRNAMEEEKKVYRDTYLVPDRLRHHGMNPGDK